LIAFAGRQFCGAKLTPGCGRLCGICDDGGAP
jgi:hypothetical protein